MLCFKVCLALHFNNYALDIIAIAASIISICSSSAPLLSERTTNRHPSSAPCHSAVSLHPWDCLWSSPWRPRSVKPAARVNRVLSRASRRHKGLRLRSVRPVGFKAQNAWDMILKEWSSPHSLSYMSLHVPTSICLEAHVRSKSILAQQARRKPERSRLSNSPDLHDVVDAFLATNVGHLRSTWTLCLEFHWRLLSFKWTNKKKKTNL